MLPCIRRLIVFPGEQTKLLLISNDVGIVVVIGSVLLTYGVTEKVAFKLPKNDAFNGSSIVLNTCT